MVRRSNFDADVRGIGEMLCAGYMRSAMMARIRAVEALAINNSPVGDPTEDETAGEYIGSFSTEGGIQQGPPQPGVPVNRRAYGQLTNSSDHAMAVEYGQHGVRRRAPMRKALRAIPSGFAGSTYRDDWTHRW